MFGRKISPESVRDRLIEERPVYGDAFFLELGKLLVDMHDHQILCRRICKGKIFLSTESYLLDLFI